MYLVGPYIVVQGHRLKLFAIRSQISQHFRMLTNGEDCQIIELWIIVEKLQLFNICALLQYVEHAIISYRRNAIDGQTLNVAAK